MCGRYTLALPLSRIVDAFRVSQVTMEEWPPRYNIAPTQAAPAVVRDGEGERRLGLLRWGLVPGWADDPSIGNRMINARAETAASKPAFRNAFRRRRCLVPADGFYEWRKPDSGKGAKTPFHIRRADGEPLAFAGLWERWRPRTGEGEGGGEPLHTFTLLTTAASEWMKPLHHRMPVILEPEEWADWLDEEAEPEALESLVQAPRHPPLEAVEVSTRVNSPGNDDEGCVEPVPDGERVSPGGD